MTEEWSEIALKPDFIRLPKIIGYFRIAGGPIRIGMYRSPTEEQQKNYKEMLDWEYYDA